MSSWRAKYLTLACAVLLASSIDLSASDKPPTDRFTSIEARIGGHLGVAAIETASGKRIDYRPDERFPMCSTFKFLAVAAVLKRVDEKQERLDRKEPELNSAIPGDERDTTTPGSMLADMMRLLVGDVLSPSSRRQLEDWLQKNKTGAAMIRAGAPTTWIIGDKTGRGANGATNDIAIMHPPSRAPTLLAIYSVGSSASANDRAAAIAEAAKIVVESL